MVAAAQASVLAGHVTLESGLVRAKHSVNAAAKALVQTGITALAIWMIGHGLMRDGGPLSGRGPIAPADPQLAGPLLFDIALACAAATILAGPTADQPGRAARSAPQRPARCRSPAGRAWVARTAAADHR
jgi:ammonia channel protein AmtB